MSDKNKSLSREHIIALSHDLQEFGSKLSEERKNRLSETLGVAPHKIQIWFQNQRTKEKKKCEEDEYQAALNEYKEVMKLNEFLRARTQQKRDEVMSLRARIELRKGNLNGGNETSPINFHEGSTSAFAGIPFQSLDGVSHGGSTSAFSGIPFQLPNGISHKGSTSELEVIPFQSPAGVSHGGSTSGFAGIPLQLSDGIPHEGLTSAFTGIPFQSPDDVSHEGSTSAFASIPFQSADGISYEGSTSTFAGIPFQPPDGVSHDRH